MRNRDAVAEVSVRLPFPAEHALDITGSDMSGINQDLAGGTNRFLLVRGAHAETNVLW